MNVILWPTCPPDSIDDLPPLSRTTTSRNVPAIEHGPSPAPARNSSVSERHRGQVPVRDPEATVHDKRPRRSGRTRVWTSLTTFAALGLVVYTLRDKLPSLGSVGAALTGAEARWVLAALVLETMSLVLFARQQQVLLRAMSVNMSMARTLAVTYARSAIAISMPAGSAVSAAFAYRQFRRGGASRDAAAAVTVSSGLVSFAGIALLYVFGIGGFVAVSPEQAWDAHSGLILTVAAGSAISLAAWMAARWWQSPPASTPHAEIVATSSHRPVRRWASAAVMRARSSIALWRRFRPGHWALAVTFAALNWLLDLLCLAATAEAFRLRIGLLTLASVYLGVQLVRQVPVTPGGIGLIETGLLAGFAALGAPAATAAAAVLTYRVLSCWLLIPVGGAAWLGLRTMPARTLASAASRSELAVAGTKITASS